MQRRASSRYGAGNAAVGQASRQARQLPQWSPSCRSGGSVERGEDRAQEQPRAEFARHEIGVLALPAEAGLLGERLLHHRGGVDEHFHVDRRVDRLLAARFRRQPARHRLEPRLDDLVIVDALRIDRDRAVRPLAQDRQRVGVGPVVHAEHDDGAHLRPQRARIAAPCRGRFHPLHVAVAAVGQELAQPVERKRDGIGTGHADDVEALRARRIRERGLQRRGIAQKSRSG